MSYVVIDACTEAVELARRLAQVNHAFVPGLAMSLRNQSVYLHDLGREEEGAAASAEAAELFRSASYPSSSTDS